MANGDYYLGCAFPDSACADFAYCLPDGTVLNVVSSESLGLLSLEDADRLRYLKGGSDYWLFPVNFRRPDNFPNVLLVAPYIERDGVRHIGYMDRRGVKYF